MSCFFIGGSKQCGNIVLRNEQGTEEYHVIKDIIKKDKERWMFDNLEDELTKDIAYQLSAIYESWIVCNVTFDRLIQSF